MNIGIIGYGNLGRGVELAAHRANDNIVGIFTRRGHEKIRSATGEAVYSSTDVEYFSCKTDVLAVCGGSATDLPEMTPTLARSFNVVDSYDDHEKMGEHVRQVDEAALAGGHTAIVGCGWDPGLFSLVRLYFRAFFPNGTVTTYWGRGVSQGHSEAVRHIDGVIDAREYTVPIDSALDEVRRGGFFRSAKELHRREVFVVAMDGADRDRIVREIKEMPDYFAGYETAVTFITAEEMREKHSLLPHGGGVMAFSRGGYGNENISRAELSLTLDSNPEFTGEILLRYARVAFELNRRGEYGCRTVFDIAARDVLDCPE